MTLNTTIHDVETGEITVSPMTKEELAIIAQAQSDLEQEQKNKLQRETDRVLLLEKLGITEDEAKLLLG